VHRIKVKGRRGRAGREHDDSRRPHRADFDRAALRVVNLIERAGSGQNHAARGRASPARRRPRRRSLEGDVQGSMDADRLRRLHVPVHGSSTDPGFGGECHLDANMVRSALPGLPLDDLDLLVIEERRQPRLSR